MKKIFLAFSLTFIALIFASNVNAQVVSFGSNVSGPLKHNTKVVGTTCFGDCGGSSQLMYVCKNDYTRGMAPYEVVCNFNDLCGNIGTMGRVFVNGMLVKNFDFTLPGSGATFMAKNGDVIMIEATPEEFDENITCMNQGSFGYTLIQK